MTTKTLTKTEEFSSKELEELIPQQLYSYLSNSEPDLFERCFNCNTNMDEYFKTEVIFAYSWYEALNDRQKRGAKYGLSNVTSQHLLNFIAQNNIKLFDRIEQIYDRNPNVIDYLENQIVRIQALVLAFDEQIREKKSCQSFNQPNTAR